MITIAFLIFYKSGILFQIYTVQFHKLVLIKLSKHFVIMILICALIVMGFHILAVMEGVMILTEAVGCGQAEHLEAQVA